jgi:hypothetical protein
VFLATPKARLWLVAGALMLAALGVAWFTFGEGDGGVGGGGIGGTGGSPFGVVMGLVAVALILLLTAFGIRKRSYRSKLGTLEGWLVSHVVLGVVVLFVVLAHTGFRFEDRVAVAAFVALALVVVSGLVGAALYTAVPRLLTEVQSNLAPAEISDRLNRIQGAMGRLASGRSRELRAVYRQMATEAAPGPRAGWRLLLGRHPVARTDDAQGRSSWGRTLATVPPDEQEPLRQLLMLARQHRELHLRLAYQERFKNLLDVWLWIHLPVTVLLLVLTAVHVVGAVYFGDPFAGLAAVFGFGAGTG